MGLMKNTNHPSKDNVKLAIFAVVFAVLVLSFGDAVIKSLSVSFPLSQIYVIRSMIALLILYIVIMWREPTLALMPKSVGWTATRSLFLASMWVAYYSALPHMKLSVAAAVYYTIPLFITLFSALFTGDKVGVKSWLAIVLGFAGVIIIVRPDTGGFNSYVLLPLIAAILYALAMILTRTKCVDENPKVLAFALNVMFILMGAAATLVLAIWSPNHLLLESNSFLLGDWVALDTRGWFAMSVLSIVIVVGSLFSAIAYQNGPPSLVASFDYSYLVFSAVWGFVFFTETPDALTILGMAMITVAGLIAVRE